MDIQIVGAEELDHQSLVVYRQLTKDGVLLGVQPHKMPKESLAIRAAEYDLDPEDPFALDLLLLERWSPIRTAPGELHPLYGAPTIAEALVVMEHRVEAARVEHGAPEDPVMRSLFHAADVDESTQGLTDTKAMLVHFADRSIAWAVQDGRDIERRRVRRGPRTVGDNLKAQAMSRAWDQALAERDARKLSAPPTYSGPNRVPVRRIHSVT